MKRIRSAHSHYGWLVYLSGVAGVCVNRILLPSADLFHWLFHGRLCPVTSEPVGRALRIAYCVLRVACCRHAGRTLYHPVNH